MTLEELIAYLEGQENGTEMVAALKNELSKKNREAQNLRSRAKNADETLKTMKAQVNKLLTALDLDELGEDDTLEDVTDALEVLNTYKQKGEGKGTNSPEFEELQKQVKLLTKDITKLQKDKETLEGRATEERAKRQNLLVQNQLLAALEAGKAVKPAKLIKMLTEFVKVDENDNLVFVKEDGEEVDVKAGVTDWLADNPEFVVNTAVGGSGGGSGSPGGKTAEELGKEIAEARNKGNQAPASGLNIWSK